MDLHGYKSIYQWQFSYNISNSLKNLYENKHFSDVTLISEDYEQVMAHKFILSSCSRTFAKILEATSASVIYLKGLNSREMDYLLQYCYLGQVTVSNDSVDKLMVLLKEFELCDSGEKQGQEQLANDDEKDIVYEEERGNHEMLNIDNLGKIQEKTEYEAFDFDNTTSEILTMKTNKTKRPYIKKTIELEDRNLKCDSCGYIAKRFGNLQSHKKSVHMGIKNPQHNPLPCDICGKVLGSKVALLVHIRSIHDKIPFKCNFENCTYSVKTKLSLDQHIQYVHEGKEYHCENCPKKFTKMAQMKKHYYLQHSDAPYILCEKCDFKTKDKERFKKHQAGHEGKKVSCDKCDFKTVWKYNLNDHLRKVHKQPLFKCTFCTFDSVSEDAVNVHVNSTHFQTT